MLLGAAVSRRISIVNPLVARQDALRSTVIRLREGFRRKGQSSSASSSEGCGSSVKRSSSSVEAGHGNAVEAMSRSNSHCVGEGSNWNNLLLGRASSCHEAVSSDGATPSLVIRSSSCRSVVQDSDVGAAFADKHLDHNNSLVLCSSSGLESQGCESSRSFTTSTNQQVLENFAMVFQDKLNDPRITSMLKKKGGQGDRELATLLQDKGLDPNFALLLKEKGLDPRILALLQRSSLDADRDHQEAPDVTAIDSFRLDTALPNQMSLSEELRRNGLGKWHNLSRLILHHIASTPERALILFSLVFVLETSIVAVFRPKAIKLINATHEQVKMTCLQESLATIILTNHLKRIQVFHNHPYFCYIRICFIILAVSIWFLCAASVTRGLFNHGFPLVSSCRRHGHDIKAAEGKFYELIYFYKILLVALVLIRNLKWAIPIMHYFANM